MTEDRQAIWDASGATHKQVRRMFLEYSRYFEANLILDNLMAWDVDITNLKVLDFGAGVGDYGMTFARAGAEVTFWDFPRSLGLIRKRVDLENIKANVLSVDTDTLDYNFNLIIYGEVLEHLDNPVGELLLAVTKGTEYIFTSSYPNRTDNKDDPYWNNHDHDDNARIQQPVCRELLEKSYYDFRLDGEARLWVRK